MLQPARLFWALAALVLVLQVAAFGSNGRFQEPAADNSDKAKTQLTSKSSKKRKKKKAVTTVPYVVFSPSPQTPVTSASPITVNSVEELPTPPPPAARNVSGAEKTPGVHVAPTGIPTATPLGPAPTATAGQLLFRVPTSWSQSWRIRRDGLLRSITPPAPIIRLWPRVALVTALQLRTVLRDAAYPMELLSSRDISFVSILSASAWVHIPLEVER